MSDEINELKRMANPVHEVLDKTRQVVGMMEAQKKERGQQDTNLALAFIELKGSIDGLIELIESLSAHIKSANKIGLKLTLIMVTIGSASFASDVIRLGDKPKIWFDYILSLASSIA